MEREERREREEERKEARHEVSDGEEREGGGEEGEREKGEREEERKEARHEVSDREGGGIGRRRGRRQGMRGREGEREEDEKERKEARDEVRRKGEERKEAGEEGRRLTAPQLVSVEERREVIRGRRVAYHTETSDSEPFVVRSEGSGPERRTRTTRSFQEPRGSFCGCHEPRQAHLRKPHAGSLCSSMSPYHGVMRLERRLRSSSEGAGGPHIQGNLRDVPGLDGCGLVKHRHDSSSSKLGSLDVLNNLGSSELDEDDLMLDLELSDDQRHRHVSRENSSQSLASCLNLLHSPLDPSGERVLGREHSHRDKVQRLPCMTSTPGKEEKFQACASLYHHGKHEPLYTAACCDPVVKRWSPESCEALRDCSDTTVKMELWLLLTEENLLCLQQNTVPQESDESQTERPLGTF
ncbi:hypothetical protein WMY93_004099 [Mugilogobius chulae]|uniref:Uncharacterized protein n=1 Tax=Mugilogobius chulae TaxID=88201 RepID=A0AAW0PQ90_9GOBI